MKTNESARERAGLGLLAVLAFCLAGCPDATTQGEFAAQVSPTTLALGCCEGTGPFYVGTVAVDLDDAAEWAFDEGIGLSLASIRGPLAFEARVEDGPYAPLEPNQRIDLANRSLHPEVRVFATSCDFVGASFDLLLGQDVEGFDPLLLTVPITITRDCGEPVEPPVPQDLLLCLRDHLRILESFAEAVALLVDSGGSAAVLPPGVLVSFVPASPTDYDFTLHLDPDGDGTKQIVVQGTLVFSTPPANGIDIGDTATVAWDVHDDPDHLMFGGSDDDFVFRRASSDEVTITGSGHIGTEADSACSLIFDIPEGRLLAMVDPIAIVGKIEVQVRVQGDRRFDATLTVHDNGTIGVEDATLDGVPLPDFTLPAS